MSVSKGIIMDEWLSEGKEYSWKSIAMGFIGKRDGDRELLNRGMQRAGE